MKSQNDASYLELAFVAYKGQEVFREWISLRSIPKAKGYDL